EECFQECASLVQMATHIPVPGEGSCQAQPGPGFAFLAAAPRQGGSQIVTGTVQALQPHDPLGAQQMGFRCFSQAQVKVGVAPLDCLLLKKSFVVLLLI